MKMFRIIAGYLKWRLADAGLTDYEKRRIRDALENYWAARAA